ncbi:MAG: ABC transporter ATP-binding protein [Deltaproteobacteria bacterium]|jgi:branched-chain amino acid transport system ATP-binding protein|nr:MAG: ABC transporter ATP-binding protein [Deltaproteobacteria bacterium]
MSLLSISGVAKRFGGLLANDDISFEVGEGEIIGLIGPNGAGKTTLFSCIAGYFPVTSGTIVFDGKRISGLPPEAICRRGIARTFQIVRVFKEMSVLENVMVGAFLSTSSRREAEAHARAVLGRVGLSGKAESFARSLTVSEQKRVQLARALATRPRLLLLDEVMAGLTPQEISEAVSLVRTFREDGLTMIVVEHVMEAVMPISDRVVVLDYGKKIAEGAPGEIVRDERVIEAYLGVKHRASH